MRVSLFCIGSKTLSCVELLNDDKIKSLQNKIPMYFYRFVNVYSVKKKGGSVGIYSFSQICVCV